MATVTCSPIPAPLRPIQIQLYRYGVPLEPFTVFKVSEFARGVRQVIKKIAPAGAPPLLDHMPHTFVGVVGDLSVALWTDLVVVCGFQQMLDQIHEIRGLSWKQAIIVHLQVRRSGHNGHRRQQLTVC